MDTDNNKQTTETPDHTLRDVPGMESSKHAFSAPRGYFDDLSSRISAAAESSGNTPSRNTIFSRRVFWIPVSAISLLVIAFFVFSPPGIEDPGSGRQTGLGSLPEDSIVEYAEFDASYQFDNHMEDLNTSMVLMDSLDQEDDVRFVDLASETWDVPDEVIVDYLMDQDVDPVLLAEL